MPPDGKRKWGAEVLCCAVKVRFTRKNDFGIVDHYVNPGPDVEVFVPMRVVPNGHGSEVIFTVFQPGDMSDEKYAEDIRWVEQDLKALKGIMERRKGV
ncbi:MAG TPA: hypothetical protein VFM04_09315 [Candidatus Methylomirabilis sp.]|nr:hypothetical protein [Candidatus Methylomirabilis sp.]